VDHVKIVAIMKSKYSAALRENPVVRVQKEIPAVRVNAGLQDQWGRWDPPVHKVFEEIWVLKEIWVIPVKEAPKGIRDLGVYKGCVDQLEKKEIPVPQDLPVRQALMVPWE
jgi:hypothetical protein